jgi:hypothetical protein
MKTAQEILDEKVNLIGLVYPRTTQLIINAMEEYASQFKKGFPTFEEVLESAPEEEPKAYWVGFKAAYDIIKSKLQ